MFVVLASSPARHALAEPSLDGLATRVKPAGSSALIDEDTRAYVRAHWHLRTGALDSTLKDLDGLSSRLFADRAQLMRGQAFESRRNFEDARRAYLDALQASVSAAVSEAALRGLISITGKIPDWNAQIVYLDALIDMLSDPMLTPAGRSNATPVKMAEQIEMPDPALELQRINALLKAERIEDAQRRAWAVLDSWPDQRSADSAEKLLVEMRHKKLETEERGRIALASAHHWLRLSRHSRALSALNTARSSLPKDAARIDLELADAYALRRATRPRAEALLAKMVTRADLGDLKPEVLLRLGKVAADRYQFPRARSLFEQVIAAYPGTPAAAQSAYEAAQVEYDAGDYGLAAKKMGSIERGAPSPELARNALWMAGWSAYLAQSTNEAIDKLELLRNSDPDGEMMDRAEYWLARAHERAEHWRAAIDGYRGVASRSPFRYYGLWSRAHLLTLHAPVSIHPPEKVEAPERVEDMVVLLGADRPITVDRAVALFRANLRQEGIEELLAAFEHFRRTRNRLGMTISVDIFRFFGREAWASLIARNIADDSPEQPNTEDYFWRIWRYAYPTPFEQDVERASNAHYVDPFLTYAVMRTESRFRPDAVSAVGARGLMQLMPATARWIARITPEAKPEAARYRAVGPNIWLGSWYLRDLVDRFGKNAVHVLGAYNAGPAAVERWIKRFGDLGPDEFAERVPYGETRNYIRRTVESFMIYHALYDRPPTAASDADPDHEG
jgi:soluble lytic murein transglycosylase